MAIGCMYTMVWVILNNCTYSEEMLAQLHHEVIRLWLVFVVQSVQVEVILLLVKKESPWCISIN